MMTAVQRRECVDIFSYTVYGNPVEIKKNDVGEVAVYGVGEIVVYVIERPHLLKAFLFRTSKKGSYQVPGVFPAVDLFVQTRTRTKTRRFMGYLNHVREKKIDLNALPDGFFIRLNNMLEVSKKKHDFSDLLKRYQR